MNVFSCSLITKWFLNLDIVKEQTLLIYVDQALTETELLNTTRLITTVLLLYNLYFRHCLTKLIMMSLWE